MPEENIGPYTHVTRLEESEGEQGSIYRARKDGAEYILKAPRHARFREAEIQAWKQVSHKHHPHVLPLSETFTHQGQVYLVSKFVEQGTLKDWLANQPGKKASSLSEALQIFRGIVSGLAYVHAVDLAHRDLKPGNILLSYGHPMLMDFGLARITSKTVLTMGVGGTLAYAPPEIAKELVKELMGVRRDSADSICQRETPISKRGDVWSAGVILYELIFGVLPYEDLDALLDTNAQPADLQKLPPPLAAFLQKALEKRPENRFRDALELQTSLISMSQELARWESEKARAAVENEKTRLREQLAQAELAAKQARQKAEQERRAREAEVATRQLRRNIPIVATIAGVGITGVVGGPMVYAHYQHRLQEQRRYEVAQAKFHEEGVTAFKTGNYKEAFPMLLASAEGGNAEDMSRVGFMYEKGWGVSENYAEAFKWYKKSADKNHPDGMAGLGIIYLFGGFIPKNNSEALRWIRKSIENGSSRGMNTLGVMYETAEGIEKNDTEAFKWYKMAAECGSPLGMYNMGWAYEAGIGIPKNDFEAFKWYQKAAENGELSGMDSLGSMYRDGKGVSPNDYEAVKWYRKAAESGDTSGTVNLGFMYHKGKGGSPSDSEAVEWYRKAAENGEPLGMNNLGSMYEDGAGVEKNLSMAKFWYQKASALGNDFAKKNLERLGK